MPHSLIAGMTCTGKSSVAKLLVPRWRKRTWGGRPYRIAVLDPVSPRGLGWGLVDGDCHFADPDQFILFCKSSIANPLAIFVDEGAQSLSRGVDYNWLTTQARHWGHESHIISQRATDLHPAIRGNCEWLYLFQTDPNTAKLLALEWNQPTLLQAVQNPRLHLHLARRLADVHRARVDFTARTLVFLGAEKCTVGPSPSPSRRGKRRSSR